MLISVIIYNCNFYGDQGAGAGAGDGLVKNGAGKIIGAEIRGDKAGMNALLRASHIHASEISGT